MPSENKGTIWSKKKPWSTRDLNPARSDRTPMLYRLRYHCSHKAFVNLMADEFKNPSLLRLEIVGIICLLQNRCNSSAQLHLNGFRLLRLKLLSTDRSAVTQLWRHRQRRFQAWRHRVWRTGLVSGPSINEIDSQRREMFPLRWSAVDTFLSVVLTPAHRSIAELSTESVLGPHFNSWNW